MTRDEYQRYLASPWWQWVRGMAMQRAQARLYGACERCGERRAIDVHHLSYVRLGAEWPEDLLAVCRECHAELHGLPPSPPPIGFWESLGDTLHAARRAD